MLSTSYDKRLESAKLGFFPDTELDKLRATSLTLDLTHRCPFNCPGCIEKEGMSYSRYTNIHLGTACRLIRQFASQDGRELCLYGGEPTAHPNFDKVVLYAADCVESIRVVTNGALLEKPVVAEAILAAAEVTKVSVRVSLNAGTPETHEALHGVKGYFPIVVRGMKLLNSGNNNVQLGVSYLVEEANANEVIQAYEIAGEVGAKDFWLRAKTGLNGIGLVPMSSAAKKAVLEAATHLMQSNEATTPILHVAPWYLRFLKTNIAPETTKPYPVCYYCAASRLVITPPEPGVVWSCTYWRASPRFHVANLDEVPFGSLEFELRRFAAMLRIFPPLDCAGVICDRNELNKSIWQRLRTEKELMSTLSAA